MFGFAVCRYDGSRELYRFSCDRDWGTVNDSLHEDEVVVMAALPLNYEAGERVKRRSGRGRGVGFRPMMARC